MHKAGKLDSHKSVYLHPFYLILILLWTAHLCRGPQQVTCGSAIKLVNSAHKRVTLHSG
jgi:hypothetical protein